MPSNVLHLDAQADAAEVCGAVGIKLEDLLAELEYRRNQKALKMRKRMALAAKAGGVRRMLKDEGDGGGAVDMMIDPISYHYWGRRLGYPCWDDPEFIREYKRDNPESRVKSIGAIGMETAAMRFNKAKALPVLAHRSGHAVVGRRGRWAA